MFLVLRLRLLVSHPSPRSDTLPEVGTSSLGTPYDGLYEEATPGRCTFFRLQVYARVGISLVEVSETVGKSVIWDCKIA